MNKPNELSSDIRPRQAPITVQADSRIDEGGGSVASLLAARFLPEPIIDQRVLSILADTFTRVERQRILSIVRDMAALQSRTSSHGQAVRGALGRLVHLANLSNDPKDL